ncbi:MAG: hypothetical protein HS107_08965 [Thermoflexaceae bacterium]|nr:hypothetical protein [Thermoflexaceae bacterium]
MSRMRRVPVSGDKGRKAEHLPISAGEGEQEPPAAPSECACPRLDPADWHDVESDWSDIAFVKGAVSALLGVPVGYAGARAALEKKARAAGATIPPDAMFLLGSGRFRRPMLVEVEGADRRAKGIHSPGGVAYSRLVEAPWGEMRRVVEETREAAIARYGRRPDSLLLWYLTCRECSRERNFETLVIAHYRGT